MENKKFFSKKFNDAYETKWKTSDGRRKTDGDFAQALRNASSVFDKPIKVNLNSISNWKHGKQIPEQKTINLICEVLDLPSDYFDPMTREEIYTYDQQYQKNLCGRQKMRSDKIGLNLDFLSALHDLVPFDECFPLYSRIERSEGSSSSLLEYLLNYRRGENYESAQLEDPNSIFQITRGDKTYTLSISDLYFLKELQDQVSDFVEYKFHKRSKEMEKEVESANKIARSRSRALDLNELIEIDKYSKYLIENEKEISENGNDSKER